MILTNQVNKINLSTTKKERVKNGIYKNRRSKTNQG